MAHHNLLSNKNKKKELARIYEEFEVYRGLKPTTKPKKEFKKLYKEIQARLISEGKFPNKQARDLNRAVLKEIGEFPYWSHGGTTKQNNAAVEFGQGIVHKMSGGEARPAFLRDASNEASDAIRLQRTNWANDLMSAAGFETEVKEGKSLFSPKNRIGGKAWDHTYELQEFGTRYKAILEEYASGSIDEAAFKKLIAGEVSKNPGDIRRNLQLLDEAENYSKRARIEKKVKEFKKGEAYKVRDAKYTEFQKLDDVTKASKLEEAHKQAVKFTKYDFASRLAAEAPDYKVTKVVDKVNGNGLNGNGANGLIKNGKGIKNGKVAGVLGATGAVLNNKGVRTALKFGVPGVYMGMSILNMQSKAAELEQDDTWQNKAQYGIAGAETALEGFELATGGLGAIVTTPLQIALTLADQLIYQTEDEFERPTYDYASRRRYRTGQS